MSFRLPLTCGKPSQLIQQKWEAKLLESKVADFIHAAPQGEDVSDDEERAPAPSANGRNGNANGAGSSAASEGNEPFGYTGAIEAGQPLPPSAAGASSGLALPGATTGLALPGMGVFRANVNGSGNGNGNGVQVKQEEDPLRLRGGAVCCHFVCHCH